MRTVVYVLESLGLGGTERSLVDITAGLTQVRPLVTHLVPPASLAPAYRQRGVEVVSLGLSDRYRFGLGVVRLLELVRARRPALIHTATFAANIVGRTAGRIAGIPVVSSVVGDTYGPAYQQRIRGKAKAKHRVVQALDFSSARWVRRFIANSRVLEEATVEHLRVPRDRIEVIYRGRSAREFTPCHPTSKLRQQLGMQGRRVVLSVGRLREIKAHDDLIRASALLCPRFPDLTVVLAGDGPQRAELEALARTLNAPVKFLGMRHDVAELLSLAEVFVSASTTEGHPGAVVEAMMTARPVLLSDIDVHRETIGGDAGRLFALRDVEDLARQLAVLLNSQTERDALGERALAHAGKHYDLQEVIRRHEELYLKIISGQA